VGVFTRLPDAALAELAAAFELGVVASCTPIAAGTINSNFAVETARGRWFLRVNEGKTEADVGWEAQLVTALAAAGVPTPAPVPAGDRLYAPLGDKWVSVFPWRPGRHLAAAEVTESLAHELGAALAALHTAAAVPPRASIYDHDHLLARFATFAASRDPELAHAIAVLADELAIATAAREVRARASHGIIHGDLFRDNVLWEAGRLVAILDFEQASSGSFAYDLAVCLNDWCWTGAPRPALAHALLAGYSATRPLTADDRDALPIEVRAAAARFTITRITDVYLAKVDNPEKDFRAFLTRCEAWRGQALGQLAAAL
jgi:homoserine kinase type II